MEKLITVLLFITLSGLVTLAACSDTTPVTQPDTRPIEVTVPDSLLVNFPDSLKISDVVQVKAVGEKEVTVSIDYLSTWRSKPGFFYFSVVGTITNLSDRKITVEGVDWKLGNKKVTLQAIRLPKVIQPGYSLPFYILTGDISETLRYEAYTFELNF